MTRLRIKAAKLACVLTLAAVTFASSPIKKGEIIAPGAGMIEHPCPAFEVPVVRELAEPGTTTAPDPKLASVLLRNQTYFSKNDWAWHCRYQADNHAVGKSARVVFMGDSITEGWQRYDPKVFKSGIVDRGIGGQTSSQMVARFYQDVVALHPQVVHIMAGTNDVAGNTGPNSPEDFKNNIRAMVDLARANRIKVVLGSVLPAKSFWWATSLTPAPQITELNAWLKSYAAEQGIGYADYYHAMAAFDGAPAAGLTVDGVHPGMKGYATMRPIAVTAIRMAMSGEQRAGNFRSAS